MNVAKKNYVKLNENYTRILFWTNSESYILQKPQLYVYLSPI